MTSVCMVVLPGPASWLFQWGYSAWSLHVFRHPASRHFLVSTMKTSGEAYSLHLRTLLIKWPISLPPSGAVPPKKACSAIQQSGRLEH